MQHEQKPLKETLQPLLRVLSDLGGKFSFMDEEGNQFVLASKEVFEGEQEKVQEQQLTLPQAETVSRAIRKHIDPTLEDEVLDDINRDIALAYAVKQELEEEVMDDLAAITEGDAEMEEAKEFSSNRNIPVPPRIRFEPLRGDLPPDLQE
jgi:hypothetical protein